MTVPIDAEHVRAVWGHQGGTFEVMVAQVSNDDGKPAPFSVSAVMPRPVSTPFIWVRAGRHRRVHR